jgi:hypothetical protein
MSSDQLSELFDASLSLKKTTRIERVVMTHRMMRTEVTQRILRECGVNINDEAAFRLYRAHYCHREMPKGCLSDRCKLEHADPRPKVSDEWYAKMKRAYKMREQFRIDCVKLMDIK